MIIAFKYALDFESNNNIKLPFPASVDGQRS